MRKLRFRNNCEYVFTHSTLLTQLIDVFTIVIGETLNKHMSHLELIIFISMTCVILGQVGTPLYTLKNSGGWETLEMVNKYAHFNADHMLEFANNVTFTAQSPISNNEINVSSS